MPIACDLPASFGTRMPRAATGAMTAPSTTCAATVSTAAPTRAWSPQMQNGCRRRSRRAAGSGLPAWPPWGPHLSARRDHDIGATGRIRSADGGPDIGLKCRLRPLLAGWHIEDDVVDGNVPNAPDMKFLSEDLTNFPVADQDQATADFIGHARGCGARGGG